MPSIPHPSNLLLGEYIMTVKSYEEGDDTFACHFDDCSPGAGYDYVLPAFLMSVIARKVCGDSTDLPYGLVGKQVLINSAA